MRKVDTSLFDVIWQLGQSECNAVTFAELLWKHEQDMEMFSAAQRKTNLDWDNAGSGQVILHVGVSVLVIANVPGKKMSQLYQ